MRGFRKASTLAAALTVAACSPEIDRVYEVDTVRILAVQKTVDRGEGEPNGGSYARPGETVNFHMLWDAGSRNKAAGIPVQRLWIKGCVNPKGDTFDGCADFLLEAAQDPEQFVNEYVVPVEEEPRPSSKDTIAVTMPGKEALRPAANEMPAYALYIVFFAACAGEIGFTAEDVSIQDGRLPITCKRDGELLGPDDFVVGYSSVYIFEDQKNENPLIDSLQFWKDPTRAAPPQMKYFGLKRLEPPACAGVGCFDVIDPTTEEDINNLCTVGLCVEPCADDGDIDKCPGHQLVPWLTDGGWNAEKDTVSTRKLKEQLNVHYHADRGKMRSDVRVVRDGSEQWNNGGFASNYYAPAEPGPARLWVVLRDNRGGVDWMSLPLWIR
ncbi:MAG TPA: hypothetical protein VI072_04230 [Polyangiaceae bacterium]